jgi:hypothetical protein
MNIDLEVNIVFCIKMSGRGQRSDFFYGFFRRHPNGSPKLLTFYTLLLNILFLFIAALSLLNSSLPYFGPLPGLVLWWRVSGNRIRRALPGSGGK